MEQTFSFRNRIQIKNINFETELSLCPAFFSSLQSRRSPSRPPPAGSIRPEASPTGSLRSDIGQRERACRSEWAHDVYPVELRNTGPVNSIEFSGSLCEMGAEQSCSIF